MARPPKPLVGYNTNVRHLGHVFHVQTEDSGYNLPHVYSHLFKDGAIISSKKTSYADERDKQEREHLVRRIMQEQHKALLKELKRGIHDKRISLLFNIALPEDHQVKADVSDKALLAATTEVDASKTKTDKIERVDLAVEAATAAAAAATAAAAAAPAGGAATAVLAALEEEVAADVALNRVAATQEVAQPADGEVTPPEGTRLPDWFGASRRYETLELEAEEPDGTASEAAELLAALEAEDAAAAAAAAEVAADAMAAAESLPREQSRTDKMRIPVFPTDSVSPPVPPLRSPTARATPAYMARPAGGFPAAPPVPPAATPPPTPQARGTGTHNAIPPLPPRERPNTSVYGTPVVADPVTARPVFRVGGTAGGAPVPPITRRPLPPRVQPPPAPSATPTPPEGGTYSFQRNPSTAVPVVPAAQAAQTQSQQRPAQADTIFGEDLVSEKSLDEVILNYLADDIAAGGNKPK